MKIIAHRCGTDIYPEQSLDAGKYSLSLGTDLIEVDIRFTKDGKPVVIHDATPEKLYNSSVRVSEMTENEFLAMRRILYPEKGPNTFSDFLEAGISDMLFHIKEGGDKLHEIIALCKEYSILDSVVFGVQCPEDVRLVKEYGDVQVLGFMRDDKRISEYAEAGADYIRLWEQWCSEKKVSEVLETGKKLWIMSNSPTVGEVTEGCYEFYEKCNADGVLVNRIVPAIGYYKKK